MSPDAVSDREASPRRTISEAAVRGKFPARYQIGETEADGRRCVTDPASDRRWAVGANELLVARCFDGVSTYGEISRVVQERVHRALSVDKVQAFEAKLIAMGLLECSEPARSWDPFTGFHFGWLHRLLVIKLIAGKPERALEAILRALPRLTSRTSVAALLISTAVVLTAVFVRLPELTAELMTALAGWGTVFLYAAAVSSAVFHEGGHALACRHYGVTVREMGVAIYFLLPFAWTRPDQDAWCRLPLRARVVTIFAGPFGSLVFAALGGVAWLFAPADGLPRVLGVYAMIAGAIGVIPTMLPIFNGDGYLLLTELLGISNLRRRAFDHLHITLINPARAARIARRDRLLYLGVALVTIAGWMGVVALVLWSVWTFSVKAALT